MTNIYPSILGLVFYKVFGFILVFNTFKVSYVFYELTREGLIKEKGRSSCPFLLVKKLIHLNIIV